jgi:hypothetical protein
MLSTVSAYYGIFATQGRGMPEHGKTEPPGARNARRALQFSKAKGG